jgi:hypothetical protein
MSILWASLVSAGVALLVTLLVEYTAKPWLEARKDRIVESGRERRALLRGLRRAYWLAGEMALLSGQQDSPPTRAEILKLAAEAEPLLKAATIDLWPAVPRKVALDWTWTVGQVAHFTNMIKTAVVAPEVWLPFTDAVRRVGRYNELLALPRWRWLRRRRLFSEITSDPAFRPESDYVAAFEPSGDLALTSGYHPRGGPPGLLRGAESAPKRLGGPAVSE